MLGYLDWIDTKGFFVTDVWDIPTSKWIGKGRLQLFSVQRAILRYCLTLTPDGHFPYPRIIYSTLMKSGKTAVAASIGAWALEEFPEGTEIYICANDAEQGVGNMGQALKYHAQQRGHYVTTYRIEAASGSFVQILAQHAASAAGNARTVVLFDELWGYRTEQSRRMYSEMTPIPTKPLSLQVVSTYAGYEHESDLLWEAYLHGVGREEHPDGEAERVYLEDAPDAPTYVNGKRFTYWNHEPIMPWQTDDYYDDQRKDLRPAEYLRFHENRWVTSHESFIDANWWDEAAKAFPNGSALLWGDHPYRGFPLYVGVDVGTKHDRTAAVAVAYDYKKGLVALVAHHIWTPQSGENFDLEGTVELWLRRLHKNFITRQIGYDPNQFHRSMTTLTNAGLPMVEFTQSPANMASASQLLFELLRGRKFAAYPDDECRTHLRNAVAKDTGRGFRIVKDPVIQADKRKRYTKPVDFAIALAMACYLAVESGGVDVSKPVVLDSPFGDVSPAKADPRELALPYPLRSNY